MASNSITRDHHNFTRTASFKKQTGIDDESIDWTLGNKFHLLLVSGGTATFAVNPVNPCNLVLKVLQDGSGGNALAWAVTTGEIYWAGGGVTNGAGKPTITTTADAADIISFYYDGNDKYFGVASQNFDTS